MQRNRDQALILRVDRLGDHDAIVHFFTASHGVHRGVVKAGLSSKRRAALQPATLVDAQWQSRLPEHLSKLSVEAIHGFGARVLHDPLRLAALGSITTLLASMMAEHDPHPELFQHVMAFLEHLTQAQRPQEWLCDYVQLELELLEQAGFGLDLTHCAATEATANLAYVSPKSGRAVSQSAGAPYHAKLLALPAFLLPQAAHDARPNYDDIRHGLALTGYFINERMLPALHRPCPPLRAHLLSLVARL